jgi:hypothetical protein
MIFLTVTDLIGQPYVGFKLASGQRSLENLAPAGRTTLASTETYRRLAVTVPVFIVSLN